MVRKRGTEKKKLIPENSMSTACVDFSGTFLMQQSCTFGNCSLHSSAIIMLALMA